MQHNNKIRAGLNKLVHQAITTGTDVIHDIGDVGTIKLKHGDAASMTLNVTLGGKFVAQYVPTLDEDVLTTELLGCVESLVKQHEGRMW